MWRRSAGLAHSQNRAAVWESSLVVRSVSCEDHPDRRQQAHVERDASVSSLFDRMALHVEPCEAVSRR